MSNGIKLKVNDRRHPDGSMGYSWQSTGRSDVAKFFQDFYKQKKRSPLVDLGDFLMVIDHYVERRLHFNSDLASVYSDIVEHMRMAMRGYHRSLWKERLKKSGRKDNDQPRSYELTLYPEYFDAIRNGVKTVEGRAYSNDNSYHTWIPGDTINFTRLSNPTDGVKTDDRMSVRIKSISHYETVREMLENEGWEKMQPNATSLKDAIGRYYSIDESYEDRIQEEGIFAIQIELLSPEIRV
jgi:ASC-1-like (ASCH) protein